MQQHKRLVELPSFKPLRAPWQARLLRMGAIALLAAAVMLLWDSTLLAQQDARWPAYPLDGHRFLNNEYGRGEGGYLSLFSLLLYWCVFLAWIKSVDWVNRDTQRIGMSYAIWNPIVFFPFLIGFFLFGLSVPYVGLPLTFLTFAAPFGIYVFLRNQRVEAHERVFTPDHFKHLFAGKAAKVGVKVATEKKPEYAKGAPVELTALGGETERDNAANLLKSRQSPGFVEAKNLIADALDHRADRVLMDYTQQAVGVKYEVDGVWHDVAPRDRESGDMLLAVAKTLANLNADERRARQVGNFAAEYKNAKYVCQLSSQGTQTGERAILALQGQAVTIQSLDAAGMRPKMQEQLKQLLSGSQGFVLITSMPSGGLTTTLTLTLKSLDRYMRDFIAIEKEGQRYPEVENVQPVRYNAAEGQSPADVLTSVFRKDPDVVVVHDLADADTAGMLCEQAMEDSLIISTLRAKEAVEALLRVLMLKVPASQFAPAITAVLSQRLIRKLCECKQAYAPNADLLKKLGLPPDKVKAFHRPPPPPEDPKEICKVCQGIGYHGRTSIFELLMVNDHLREALAKQPKLEVLRKVARQTGNRSLQDEGLVLVARGVTSLQELQRVLKQ